MAVLSRGLEYSRTDVYAPFPIRGTLVELNNFDKNRREIPLTSGALEPDLRF
jgi:hypothetical protein